MRAVRSHCRICPGTREGEYRTSKRGSARKIRPAMPAPLMITSRALGSVVRRVHARWATTQASASMSSPIVVDVSPLRSDSLEMRRSCAEQIRDACERVGFFYAIGHEVDEGAQAALLRSAAAFFALGVDSKDRIDNRQSYCFRGYVRQGLELTDGKPDEREQIEFGSEGETLDPVGLFPYYRRLSGPNQWPDETDVPGFRVALEGFATDMSALCSRLTRALALGLELPEAHFDHLFEGAHLQWKVCRYPLLGGEGGAGGESGVGAHSDSGFLTALVQDELGGLQALRDDGSWMDVPHVPGSVVINLGEMLQIATRGRLRATVHRVLRRPAASAGAARRSRLSIPFFYNPRLDACVDDIMPGTAEASAAHASGTHSGRNVLNAHYGENAFKSLARSHPEVLLRHHRDLVIGVDGRVTTRG